jgi:hypothetical protein
MPSDFIGSGAGPIPLGSPGSGSLAAYPVETFISPPIDLTLVTLGIELVPAKPFYFPWLVNANWLIESFTGTQTSPPTFNAGSDLAHLNFISSTSASPSNANTNASSPPAAVAGPPMVFPATPLRSIANATVFLDIASGAVGTGSFSLKARLVVDVAWQAAAI